MTGYRTPREGDTCSYINYFAGQILAGFRDLKGATSRLAHEKFSLIVSSWSFVIRVYHLHR